MLGRWEFGRNKDLMVGDSSESGLGGDRDGASSVVTDVQTVEDSSESGSEEGQDGGSSVMIEVRMIKDSSELGRE